MKILWFRNGRGFRIVLKGLIGVFEFQTGVKGKDELLDRSIHVAIRAAWFTLFEHWGANDELDLETKDANLAGLLFHQNLPLYLTSAHPAPFEVYEEILEEIRWSDRADFWAFFHQCWNLLPLSYRLKLKYPNQSLQNYAKPSPIPEPQDLQYTQVLTKQSALFNAWKEMNRVANEHDIPFRCVTQWASHQTGKRLDTLGLATMVSPIEAEAPSAGLSVPTVVPSESAPVASRIRATRGKKQGVSS